MQNNTNPVNMELGSGLKRGALFVAKLYEGREKLLSNVFFLL